jgi:Predicted xylanase/chitin deacetylase
MNRNRKILSCIALVILLAAVFAVGYFHQERVEAMGKSLEEGDKKKIALTFDDGPHPHYTEQLLDGLKKRGVKATFFVTGEHAEKHPEVIRRMSEEGD